MIRLLSVACAAIFLFCLTPSAQAQHSLGLNLQSFEKSLELAEQEKKLVMVYFWADWCGFCRQFEQEVLADSSVQKAFNESFLAVAINIQDDPGDLKSKYKVSALPTLTFLNAKGERVAYWEGFADSPTFIKIMEYITSESKS